MHTPIARARHLFLLSAAVLFAAARSLADLPAAPVAKTIPVVDDYFGTKVTDPYRWMEDPKDPDLQVYLKAQSERARSILDSIPARGALEKRVQALVETITVSSNVARRRSLLFYEKIQPGSNIERLYVRDGIGGAERLLLDPDALSHDGHHQAISHVQMCIRDSSRDACPARAGTTMQVTRTQRGIPSAHAAIVASARARRILPIAAENAAPTATPRTRLACGTAFVAARG